MKSPLLHLDNPVSAAPKKVTYGFLISELRLTFDEIRHVEKLCNAVGTSSVVIPLNCACRGCEFMRGRDLDTCR